jgi:hypothetical protein
VTRLFGRVTVGGETANGAVVEIHNATDDVVDQVLVDDDGGYEYHLSPGKWRLRAWDPHGHRAQRELRVDAGEDLGLDVELSESEGGKR